MTYPLTGVRVLDLGQGAAGPYCGQLLGDYGADVIKIEPPRGDWARTLGSTHHETGLSSTYLAVNGNKRGMCVDLSSPRGVELALRLAATCDIVVESFRPGVMDRLGLGHTQIAAVRPDVIYCSVTGFGATGPMAAVAASDSMMQPYAGLMSIVGERDGPPLRVGTIVSDMLAGSNAFSAVLLALFRRARQGIGARLEVNLLDSLLAFQSTGIVEYLVTGQVSEPPGNRHPLIGASGVTRARDGWIAIGVLDQHWPTFRQLLDTPELFSDRYATPSGRLDNQGPLWQVLDHIFAERTVDEWLAVLRSAGIVCGPVQDYAAVVSDPQVRHNKAIELGPTGLPRVAAPLRIGGIPGRNDLPPPRLGEHTRQVLTSDLNLTDAEVAVLADAGVVYGVVTC